MPLHHQLYLELRAALDGGRWGIGDRLPTERALAQQFDCSLITVRRALDELRRERRIERTPGRGTYVTAPPVERDLAALTSFSDEMQQRGLAPETRVIETSAAPAAAGVATALAIAAGAPTIVIERLRSAGGQPLLLEQVHLSAERFPGLVTADLERGSLYDLLAARFGLRPVRARERLQPILPSAREARLLGQSPRRPALLLELIAFARDEVPVEFCRAVVRGDRASYHLDASGPRIGALALDGEERTSNRRVT